MEEKLRRVYDAACEVIYTDSGGRRDDVPDGVVDSIVAFVELFPAFVQKWLDGRMSLQRLIEWTPERVGGEIDGMDRRVEEVRRQYGVAP